HIEEDTGKLLHDARFSGTLIDFNRSGLPLIEIVSQPDMHSAEEARGYLEALKAILQTLGICNCRMQEGNIRCDINVSLRPMGSTELGCRVEMKNISTFSSAIRNIEYEIARQTAILEAGGTIDNETRRWDDDKGESYPMRTREDALKHPYLPEFDMPPVRLTPEYVEEMRKTLPELPVSKFERYWKDNGLTPYEAQLLSVDPDKAAFYESCLALAPDQAKQICNWILGEIAMLQNERNCDVADLGLDPAAIVALIALTQKGTLSSTAAKTVFAELVKNGGSPEEIVERLGLAQVNDESALVSIVVEALAENEGPVAEFRKGKTNVLGFLVGQCMKKSKGKGNPQVFRKLLEEKLAE
ncbi:MAG: Asp-tRNA(Asn)/Glu-tRNA(Gln) amidotransferase subunit GatB, partial [Clostridia bacterium]|nr:Asp-tRNA(Asn)/Glu-tRNA(Gln) amidotransferase subunit GatB [Clostridia bacterium]